MAEMSDDNRKDVEATLADKNDDDFVSALSTVLVCQIVAQYPPPAERADQFSFKKFWPSLKALHKFAAVR